MSKIRINWINLLSTPEINVDKAIGGIKTDNLDSIQIEELNKLKFLELVNIIFHLFHKIYLSKENSTWYNCWLEFEKQMEEQNQHGWPSFIIIKKQYGSDLNKQKFIILGNKKKSSSFIEGQNILTMLIRIIYIERQKNEDYNIPNQNSFLNYILIKKDLKNLNIMNSGDKWEYLFALLKKFIEKYISIYSDSNECEYQIAKYIIDMYDQ